MNQVTILAATILWAVIAPLAASAQTSLVNHGDSWHYRKGTNAPQADWKAAADAGLDVTWQTGNVTYDQTITPLDLRTKQGEEFLVLRLTSGETTDVRLDHIRRARVL